MIRWIDEVEIDVAKYVSSLSFHPQYLCLTLTVPKPNLSSLLRGGGLGLYV